MKKKLHQTISNPIDKSNRGYKMLQKLGFKEGESLGKGNKGILNPLKPEIKESYKSGLGLDGPTLSENKKVKY